MQPAVEQAATSRILVADSDAETRTLHCQSLALAGYHVVEASDGREALVKALVQPPTLLVTELGLPLLDGYALCDILRRDRTTADISILVVTTETRPAELERARKMGADAVLVKPTREALLNEMRRLVARSRELRGRSAAATARVETQLQRSAELPSRSGRNHRTILVRARRRYITTTPGTPSPDLTCPLCDRPLKYEQSHIGGVSDRHPEQWDYFVCPNGCGTFQYRQRTRKVRRVE